MDSFNVPLLAESSSSNNPSNYAQQQQQQQQQQLMPHHHKDQMLAAGNAPTLMPFYQHHQQQHQQQQQQQQQQHHQKDNVNGTTENFSNSIDGSQLEDGGISLSGLCERMFASPNPHSNSNNNMSLNNNNNNNTNNNNVDNKVIATSSTIVVAAGGGGASGGGVGSTTSGSAIILESVPMPSFANLIFPQTRQPTQSSTSEALTGIDPALIQKQQLQQQQQHHQQQQQQQQQQVPSALASTIAIAGPSIEYHQLKPMEVVHTNTNFLTSTTAQLLDFEPPKDDNQITTTTAITINATGGSAEAPPQPPPPLATSLPSTTTTNTANNNMNRNQNQQMRCSLHSIEELAASSCPVAAAPSAAGKTRPTTPIAIATATTTTTTSEAGATSSQLPQSGSHSIGGGSGGGSGSNLSSDEESMSEDEFGLEIDDQGGYQDTTSSHSQQSGGGGGGGGGGANLLNGSSGSGSSTGGGGYMLLPQSNNSSHMGGPQNSTPGGNGGGGNSSSNPSAGNGNNGGGGGGGHHHPHGGTSASASGGHGGSTGGHNASGEAIDFKHLFEELCPVCGDKVSGYHYGLLTCESCKGFFKRTVQNKKVYTCVAERSCHIDKTQRKRCPYCRFQKCLEVGMKLEAVRADRMRGGRNKFGPMYKRDRARKLQVMRQRQLALQALRSSMGTDIKPSPLSPGYQQAYPNMNIKQEIQIPQVSSLTQSPDSSPSPIAIALGQVNASTGGGVITTPMNAGNGGGNGNVNGNGGNSLGNGNGSGNNNNNQNTSSTGTGSAGNNGSGGGGGGGSGGNNAGGGGGNNSGDGLHRNGSGNGGNGSNCHEAGIGSLQNTAESKLCFDSGTHPSSTADALIEPLRVSPMIREFVQSIDDREWQTQLFALLQKQTYNQVEVDLFELMCKVLDQNLFSQVDWARNTVFFKDLKVDDQMKLLQHSWSDMLVLDHLHHRIHNGLPDETQLNNGQVFNLLSLGLLGVPQLGDYFNELQNKLQDLKFDMGDYVCMKFLILLNPNVRGIVNKKTVSEGHDNVQAALLDYTLTCYPSVNDKFSRLVNILPEIHAMAARGEEHLYSKHCAGSAPTQTLLMEMLHAKRKV